MDEKKDQSENVPLDGNSDGKFKVWDDGNKHDIERCRLPERERSRNVTLLAIVADISSAYKVQKYRRVAIWNTNTADKLFNIFVLSIVRRLILTMWTNVSREFQQLMNYPLHLSK